MNHAGVPGDGMRFMLRCCGTRLAPDVAASPIHVPGIKKGADIDMAEEGNLAGSRFQAPRLLGGKDRQGKEQAIRPTKDGHFMPAWVSHKETLLGFTFVVFLAKQFFPLLPVANLGLIKARIRKISPLGQSFYLPALFCSAKGRLELKESFFSQE